MKKCLTGLLAFTAATLFAADGPSFERYPKFQIPAGSGITWAAATKALPPALRIYKVFPQQFSPAVISNLMALGEFTFQNERRHHRQVSEGNEDPLVFWNKDQTRSLSIVPAQGWIKYHDEHAPANHYDKTNHTWEPVEGLPEKAELENKALIFLQTLGIQRSDLVAKPQSTNLLSFGIKRTRSYFDRTRAKQVEDEEFYRGIFFIRKIDGISFAGIGTGGGCEVCFGNHGKIADFELIWQNLKPYQKREIATPDEIVRFIREGKAVMTHRDYVNPAEVKKLTIIEEMPFYMGADGESTQSFVFPFAQLEARAEIDGTNAVVQLYCPILKSQK